MLATLRSTIVERAGTFDPASFDGVDARLALDDLTVIVRVAESMRNRMTKQIADTNAWAGTGALDAARYCAQVTGLGSAEVRDTITAVVTDDRAAFEHPARFRVDHPGIVEVMSFTPTYAGQAQAGETLEASGWIEEDERGLRRLVVGTSREAAGEWIRTVRR